jgi:hypothetical protein
VLTEDLYIVEKEEWKNFRLYAICAIYTSDKWASIFMRDKPILSSERMLHMDYDHKGSIGKKKYPGLEPQEA